MRTIVAILVISSVALGGCGRLRDSRVNPANWFGKGQSTPIEQPQEQAEEQYVNPLIPERPSKLRLFKKRKDRPYEGTPVGQITDVTVERTIGGAILRVTAVSPRQGAFDVRLIPANKENEPIDGVLTYSIRALQPTDTAIGSTRSRTLVVAEPIDQSLLERTRTIRVVAAENEWATNR